jgi:hypothetical protein
MRAEVISSGWANPIRDAITLELELILYGSPEQRGRFLEAALEVIDVYRKLTAPAIKARELRDHKVERLEETAREFANAVYAVDDDTRDLLVQLQANFPGGDGALFPPFSKTTDAADWARITADAAKRLKSKNKHPTRKDGSLILDIATVYSNCFDERPSASVGGVFERAINVLFQAANLPEVGEKAIRVALGHLAADAPPPKRGRKPRRANSTLTRQII